MHVKVFFSIWLLGTASLVFALVGSPPDSKSAVKDPWKDPIQRLGRLGSVSPQAQRRWLGNIADRTPNATALHPVLKEFETYITTNARIRMLFESMFDQIPTNQSFNTDPNGNPQVRSYQQMLQVLNQIITTAPTWDDKAYRIGYVGLPFTSMMASPKGTQAGMTAFLDPGINSMLKKVLDTWGLFLRSPESAVVLGNCSSCWFSEAGTRELANVANTGTAESLTFEETYESDAEELYHGYSSWDAFFTRSFKKAIRPVAAPDNDSVIVHACEAQPYNIQHNVQAQDKFWMKGQPYSVRDMLAYDSLAENFIGGTIYQGFLTGLSYHRWHSPVTGRILKAYTIPGTYFSQAPFLGVPTPDLPPEYRDFSYLPTMATRSVIFVQAANPKIGIVAFLGVGMAEVSTCQITVKEGQWVQKGDKLGTFHYGGSTHVVLFGKDVKLSGFPALGGGKNQRVRSQLAVVN